MPKVLFVLLLSAVAAGNVRVNYDPFSSAIYPYRVMQPSSFRHVVLPDPLGHNIDYFYPSLGSAVTDVNIYADGGPLINMTNLLKQSGAYRVRRSGYLKIGGVRVGLVSGDRRGYPGHWREERAEFVAGGRVWHITMSYLLRYQNMRGAMLHMVRSFRLR